MGKRLKYHSKSTKRLKYHANVRKDSNTITTPRTSHTILITSLSLHPIVALFNLKPHCRPHYRPPTTILTTTSFSFSGFRWAITLQGQAALAHKYRARFLSL
jgi:hypothetical protein